jgi:hypothetical protein
VSHTPSGEEWRDVRRADWQKHETWVALSLDGEARHEAAAFLSVRHWSAQSGKSSEPDDGIKESCDATVEAKVRMVRSIRRVVVVELKRRRESDLDRPMINIMVFEIRVRVWIGQLVGLSVFLFLLKHHLVVDHAIDRQC